MALRLVLCLLLGYLLGSVIVAVVLTKTIFGGDVRERGSGNAGATNVARVFGWKAGLLTLLGDILKTAAAMLLGRLIAGMAGETAAAFGCLIGHCFPLYFHFRGGKAVSVSAAIGAFFSWKLLLILLVVFFLMFLLTRRVSACSMTAGVAFPLGMLLIGGFPWYALTLGCFIPVFVIFMHRENLKRLLKGQEPEFKFGK